MDTAVVVDALLRRTPRPYPWSEAENLPWHEPAFSERMLAEHLSQSHDAASRRVAAIERHVAWIDRFVLGGRPGRVLDLGCGPGLYTTRLARLGHQCRGVDISPAAIAYARAQAASEALAADYVLGDARSVGLGEGYDLAMFIFGELNSLRPADALTVLQRAAAALAPGGALLIEPHHFAGVHHGGIERSAWRVSAGGLFAPGPHLTLEENWWDESHRARTFRYYVLDLESAGLTSYVHSRQAYFDEEYRALLRTVGLGAILALPALSDDPSDIHPDLCVYLGRKA
jgi:SAM-dependent methyltransferase